MVVFHGKISTPRCHVSHRSVGDFLEVIGQFTQVLELVSGRNGLEYLNQRVQVDMGTDKQFTCSWADRVELLKHLNVDEHLVRPVLLVDASARVSRNKFVDLALVVGEDLVELVHRLWCVPFRVVFDDMSSQTLACAGFGAVLFLVVNFETLQVVQLLDLDGLPIDRERFHGVQDGSIASASADVAIESVLDRLLIRFGLLGKQAVHVHDHSRATKAALGAIGAGQAFLDLVVTSGLVANAFNCREGPLVAGVQWEQALRRAKRVRSPGSLLSGKYRNLDNLLY